MSSDRTKVSKIDAAIILFKQEKCGVEKFRTLGNIIFEIDKEILKLSKIYNTYIDYRKTLDAKVEYCADHKSRISGLYIFLSPTFNYPATFFQNLTALCKNYSVEYVFNVAKLGPVRMGKTLGLEFFGIKTQARSEAEKHYMDQIIPLLENFIPKHKLYIEIEASDTATELQFIIEKITETNNKLNSLNAMYEKYNETQRKVALSMMPDEIAELAPHEVRVRQKLLQPREETQECD